VSTTTTTKVLNDIRIQTPGVTDGGLALELFNVVEELCNQYLQITPPVDPTTDPATWLSDAQWQKYSRLIIDGTVARLLFQLGKPWSNHTLAQIHQQLYQDALFIVQSDSGNTTVTTSPTPSLIQRLVDNLRVNLPGVQDPWIKLELYNVVNEFCRTTGCWQDVNPITLVAGQSSYQITPTQAEIIDILSIAHVSFDTTGAAYFQGTLAFSNAPTTTDVTNGQLFVTMSLTPSLDPGTDVEHWIPSDMWSTDFDVLLEGALGRLMSQKGKPYSDPQLGMYHTRRFRMLMSTKKHQIDAGNVVDGQTWRFPQFAAQRKFRVDWGGRP